MAQVGNAQNNIGSKRGNKDSEDAKRKRDVSSLSSQSELETSDIIETENISKSEKQRKKKSKGNNTDITCSNAEISYLKTELSAINRKLENVVTKSDQSLKDMIKNMVTEMKDHIVKSLEKRIDILENTLFDKQKENDDLKQEIDSLNQKLEASEDNNKQLKTDLEKQTQVFDLKLNDIEQYSRRNSIRIAGVEDREKESPEETTTKVAQVLNDNISGLELSTKDIDIAHRLGRFDIKKTRNIIVKFKSRLDKVRVMKGKKGLKGKKIFVNDDLTKLNLDVLTAVRVKQKDFITTAWSMDGRIFYKDVNDQIHEVKPVMFNYWLEMNWPENNSRTSRANNFPQ